MRKTMQPHPVLYELARAEHAAMIRQAERLSRLLGDSDHRHRPRRRLRRPETTRPRSAQTPSRAATSIVIGGPAT
jgi:hypothetical protein